MFFFFGYKKNIFKIYLNTVVILHTSLVVHLYIYIYTCSSYTGQAMRCWNKDTYPFNEYSVIEFNENSEAVWKLIFRHNEETRFRR